MISVGLTIAQFGMNASSGKQAIIRNTQLILTILYIIFQITNIFTTFPITRITVCDFKLAALGIATTSIASKFIFSELISSYSTDNEQARLLITVLLSPVIIKFLISYYNALAEKTIFSSDEEKNEISLSIRLARQRFRVSYFILFLQSKNSGNQKEQFQMLLIMISRRNQNCDIFNKLKELDTSFANFSKCRSISFIGMGLKYNFYEDFIKMQVKEFEKLVGNKFVEENGYYYLQYLMMLGSTISPLKVLTECHKNINNMQLSLLQRLKLQYMKVHTSQNLKEYLQEHTQNPAMYSSALKYLKICRCRERSINLVMDALQSKQQFYNKFLKQNFPNLKVLYNELHNVTYYLYKVECYLKQNYKNFSNVFESKLLVLYYSEILQYYQQANQIEQNFAQCQQNFNRTQEKWMMEFDKEEGLYHMTINLGQNQGEIVSFSENIPNLLNYKSSDFVYIKKIQQVIPPPLSDIHNKLIDQFSLNCRSKFLNQYDGAFLQDANQFIIPVNLFFCINNSPTSNRLFYEAFLSLQEEGVQEFYVLTNESNHIECISQSLFKRKNIDLLDQLEIYQQLKLQTIDNLFLGDFGSIMENTEQKKNFYLQEVKFAIPLDPNLTRSAAFKANLKVEHRQIMIEHPNDYLKYNVYQFQNIVEDASTESELLQSQFTKKYINTLQSTSRVLKETLFVCQKIQTNKAKAQCRTFQHLFGGEDKEEQKKKQQQQSEQSQDNQLRQQSQSQTVQSNLQCSLDPCKVMELNPIQQLSPDIELHDEQSPAIRSIQFSQTIASKRKSSEQQLLVVQSNSIRQYQVDEKNEQPTEKKNILEKLEYQQSGQEMCGTPNQQLQISQKLLNLSQSGPQIQEPLQLDEQQINKTIHNIQVSQTIASKRKSSEQQLLVVQSNSIRQCQVDKKNEQPTERKVLLEKVEYQQSGQEMCGTPNQQLQISQKLLNLSQSGPQIQEPLQLDEQQTNKQPTHNAQKFYNGNQQIIKMLESETDKISTNKNQKQIKKMRRQSESHQSSIQFSNLNYKKNYMAFDNFLKQNKQSNFQIFYIINALLIGMLNLFMMIVYVNRSNQYLNYLNNNLELLNFRGQIGGPQSIFNALTPVLDYTLAQPVIDYDRVNFIKVIYSKNFYKFFNGVRQFVPHPLLQVYLDKDVQAFKSLLMPDQVQNVTLKRYQLLFQIEKSFKVFNNSIFQNKFPLIYGIDSVPLATATLITEKMLAEVQDDINQMMQKKIKNFSSELFTFIIPFIIVISVLMCLNILIFFKLSRMKYSVVNMFQLLKCSIIENEVKSLGKLLNKLSEYPRKFINDFNFNIYDKDNELFNQARIQETIQKQMQNSKKSNYISFPSFSVIEVKEWLFMAIYLIIFYSLIVLELVDVRRYSNSYSKSSQLLQDFYNAQIYGNSLCLYREFLYSYFINVKYLSTIYHESDFLEMFFLYLDKLEYFTNQQLLQDYDFLDSEKFKNLQLYLASTNLCQNVFDLSSTNINLCESLLNSAMTQGLPQTLSQIVYGFRTEYQTTAFNLSLRVPNVPPLDQIFATYYSATTILKFTDIINESMANQTQKAMINVIKNGLLFLAFTLIFNFYIVFAWKKKAEIENKMMSRMILIIPQIQFINSAHLFAQLQTFIRNYKSNSID